MQLWPSCRCVAAHGGSCVGRRGRSPNPVMGVSREVCEFAVLVGDPPQAGCDHKPFRLSRDSSELVLTGSHSRYVVRVTSSS